jgi:broad specificity phosphatase PhoE
VKRLLLIRHAKPTALEPGRFLGIKDVDLDVHGFREAKALTAILKAHQPERRFCSPLKRCLGTCRFAGISELEIKPDLREIDYGQWEGMTFDEIQQSDPVAVNQWANFSSHFSFPAGDRLDYFLLRVSRVADFLAAAPENTILAVTHAGIIHALICHYLGLHPRQYVLFDVGYTSLTTLDLFDGKGVLTGLNQYCLTEDFKA